MVDNPFPIAESRQSALQDGYLVDVSADARLCDLTEPVAFTKALYEWCRRSVGLGDAGVDAVLRLVKKSHKRFNQNEYDLMFAVNIGNQSRELLAVFDYHDGFTVGLFDEALWDEDWQERYGITILP